MSLKYLKFLSKYLLKQLGQLDPSDVLGPLGLEKKRSLGSRMLPAFGLFGVGLMAGFGAGLVLSSKLNEMIGHHDTNGHAEHSE